MSDRLMDISAFSFLLACVAVLVTDDYALQILLFVTAPTFIISLIIHR
jgi:hypothetical protein